MWAISNVQAEINFDLSPPRPRSNNKTKTKCQIPDCADQSLVIALGP